MSIRAPLPSYLKMQNFLQLFNRYRAFSVNNSDGRIPFVTETMLRHDYYKHQGLHFITNEGGSLRKQDTHMVKGDMNQVNCQLAPTPPPLPPPTPPPPPKFNFALWAKWLLGSVLSILLPFWKLKWGKLKQIEGEAEMVIEEADKVAEVVAKVATVTEHVSAEVAELLPDRTKLKDAALLVERVSKETAHDAQLTQNFIHKVDELTHDLHDLEKMVEPFVDKIAHQESKGASKDNS